MNFLNCTQLARRTGTCRQTIWRQCRKHPGFGIQVGAAVRIPEVHLIRLARGETIAEIAANPSLIRDDGETPRAA
jgi:hypothetical protein